MIPNLIFIIVLKYLFKYLSNIVIKKFICEHLLVSVKNTYLLISKFHSNQQLNLKFIISKVYTK